MVDKEGLVNYIKKQLNDDYDKNTILNFLIQNGYDQKMVTECFNIVEENTPNLAQDTATVNQSEKLLGKLSKLSLYIYILLGLVIIIGAGYFITTAISGSDASNGPASTAIDNPGKTTPDNPELNGDNDNSIPQTNQGCSTISVKQIEQQIKNNQGQINLNLECFRDSLINCEKNKKTNIKPSSNNNPQISLVINGFSKKDCEANYSDSRGNKKTCIFSESTLKEISPSNNNLSIRMQEILLTIVEEEITNPIINNIDIECK